MALRNVKIDEKAKTFTITMDLETPRPSSSGKTLIVATTGGGTSSDAIVNGKPVTINVNAYIKP
jgi:hypothetical protein